MAKLKIMIAGNPVLREEAKPVERIDKKLQRLLKDMAETMYAADGVGRQHRRLVCLNALSLSTWARACMS